MKKLKKLSKDVTELKELCIQTRNKRPDRLLIYYGWLNAFNSAAHGWDNEKVAQELAQYELIVLGDGLQHPGHGDYTNTLIILARLKELRPSVKVFGYVSSDQTLTNFKDKVDMWNVLGIQGIFMDESGYDFGVTRDAFIEKVEYVHDQSHAKKCFVNAWNLDHVLGTVDDAAYPNATYNQYALPTPLNEEDFCLLESLGINTEAYANDYEPAVQWFERCTKAIGYRKEIGVSMIGSSVINENHPSQTNLFNFGYISAAIFALDGYGASDVYYGASSAKVTYRIAPSIDDVGFFYEDVPVVVQDNLNTNVYLRYLDYGKLLIDYTPSSESITITAY